MKHAGFKERLFSIYKASFIWFKRYILRKNVDETSHKLFVAMISNKKFLLGMSDSISKKLLNVKIVSQVKDIRNYIGLNNIDKNDVRVVLCDDSYKMTIHDMPDIPDIDLQDAIRWQIDDELGITPENSAIDAFKVPEQGRVQDSGYLVTKPLKEVEAIQQSFSEFETTVSILTIAELGLAKLIGYLYQNQEEAVCILYLSAVGQVHIIIARGGALLFSRKLGLKDILLHPDSQSPLADECKRSFSYIKNQRQISLSKILLLQKLPTEIQQKLVDELHIEVEIVELGDLRPTSYEIGRSEYPYYLVLAGVALT